jgi:hypothetical protein
MDKCDLCFRGATLKEEDEEWDYVKGDKKYGGKCKPSEISPFYERPKKLYNSGQAICGAKGCTRACMMSLEARGKVKNQFKHPFRTKKPWTMDWSEEGIARDEMAPYTPPYTSKEKESTESDVD